MSDKIILRRGAFADLPTLDPGEAGFVTDHETLYLGHSGGNKIVSSSLIGPNSFVVGPRHKYTTVQSAIDAANAIYTTSGTHAVVFVYPKEDGYTENVTFKPGVYMKGLMGGFASNTARIIGTHSYTPSTGGQPQNTIRMDNITLDSSTGVTFTLSGSNAGRVIFTNCSINHTTHASVAVHNNNTAASQGGRLSFVGCTIAATNNNNIFDFANGRVDLTNCSASYLGSSPNSNGCSLGIIGSSAFVRILCSDIFVADTILLTNNSTLTAGLNIINSHCQNASSTGGGMVTGASSNSFLFNSRFFHSGTYTFSGTGTVTIGQFTSNVGNYQNTVTLNVQAESFTGIA